MSETEDRSLEHVALVGRDSIEDRRKLYPEAIGSPDVEQFARSGKKIARSPPATEQASVQSSAAACSRCLVHERFRPPREDEDQSRCLPPWCLSASWSATRRPCLPTHRAPLIFPYVSRRCRFHVSTVQIGVYKTNIEPQRLNKQLRERCKGTRCVVSSRESSKSSSLISFQNHYAASPHCVSGISIRDPGLSSE